MAAAKGRARRAAALLQQTWRQHAAKLAQAAHEAREAKDRVEKFFAKAIAEEAWQRAMAEIDENMAAAATKGAAEAAAAEEAARAQRRAEAKARLEVREEEERAKRQAREARTAARRPAAQARAPTPHSQRAALPHLGAPPATPPSRPSVALSPSLPSTPLCQPPSPCYPGDMANNTETLDIQTAARRQLSCRPCSVEPCNAGGEKNCP